MRTITRIYEHTPAGRRQTGYEVRDGRNRPIAQLQRHPGHWSWPVLMEVARAIAKPRSRFLDRISLTCLQDLRRRLAA